MTSNHPQQGDDGLRASFNISMLIAKAGKPHTIGDSLIMPAVCEVLNTVVHRNAPEEVIKSIPLSNNSVWRRIDEMADDVEDKLCDISKGTTFIMQKDESTCSNSCAKLAKVSWKNYFAIFEI